MCLAGWAASSCEPVPSEPPTRPNLLLITLDTTRASAVAGFGGREEVTPNLARMGRRSVLFTQAFSETNVTNPSHITMLSGLRAIRHRVLNNAMRLDPGVQLLPEILRDAGYRTAGFLAVAHLRESPGWRGFDVLPTVESELRADEVADLAIRWLQSSSPDQPFFLWVHFFDPHSLYDPPEEIADTFYPGDPTAAASEPLASAPYFERRPYAATVRDWLGGSRDPAWPRAMYEGEVHFMDQQIGRLLDTLDDLGLSDRTAVAVSADHGESLGEHGIFYAHTGLYEPQLHIPLLIHQPETGAAVIDEPVSTLDIAPTLAALAGVRFSESVNGRDLLATPLPELPFMVHQHAANDGVALRQGSWKLIWPVRRDAFPFDRGPLLFDLAEDPEEQHDLIAEHPERARSMRRKLARWISFRPPKGSPDHELSDDAKRQLEALGYVP